ncbi:MAG: ferredoxin [Acidimicrobiia bacterium]
MTLRIEINREVCMGSGNCLFWAPGVFDLDDEGIAIVVDPAGASEDKIALAVDGCPTRAITLVRDGE